MVYRYASELKEDQELDRKLLFLRPIRRRVLPVALASLCATLFVLAIFERSRGRYVFAFIGCVATLLFVAEFIQEQRVVQNWSTAVGTVLSFRKVRRGAEIKYVFKADDNRTYVGATSGGAFLPRAGRTLGIMYNRVDPSRSMPLSQFWFYEFSFGTNPETPSKHEVARS